MASSEKYLGSPCTLSSPVHADRRRGGPGGIFLPSLRRLLRLVNTLSTRACKSGSGAGVCTDCRACRSLASAGRASACEQFAPPSFALAQVLPCESFGSSEVHSSSLGGTQSVGSRSLGDRPFPPCQRSQRRNRLRHLLINFTLAPEVQAKLLAEGFNNLEELGFLFDNDEHVGRWVAKIGLGDKTMLETARLRRAWSAVLLYFFPFGTGRV